MQQSSSNLPHFSHSLIERVSFPKVDSLTKSPAEFWKASSSCGLQLGVFFSILDGWKMVRARSLQASFPLKNSFLFGRRAFLSLLGFGNFSGAFPVKLRWGGRGTIFFWKAFVCVDLFSLRFFFFGFIF